MKRPDLTDQGWPGIRRVPWPDGLALLAMTGWAAVVVRPLFDPGYPSSWDGATHFVRLKAMVELFLPKGTTNGWCPYWYNGFPPFLFYPRLFSVLVGGLYYVLGGLVPLLLLFKLFMASAYVFLPLAMYVMARSYRFTRFAAVCAAGCSLAVSAPHGIGLEGLFEVGLIPHAFALPFLLLALSAFHLGVTLGGRFVLVAAMVAALVVLTHFISGMYLVLASGLYVVVSFRRRRRRKRMLRRAMWIGALTAGLCAAAVLPVILRWSLAGPGMRWADFAFFRDFLQGQYLGGRWINWLSVAFVAGVRRRRFEETFLVILALVTLPLAMGVSLPGVSIVENDILFRSLRSRAFSFLGLLVALFAGGACDAVRRIMANHRMVAASRLMAAVLGGLLLVNAAGRVQSLKHHVQVDAHHDTPEKYYFLDAYDWLRRHAPRPAVVGFDQRVEDIGNPGYKQMASRIVLEADRFSLSGNQIQATRAHNEEVLGHLHEWDPARIHQALVRYNVSFLLTWSADVEANLRGSSNFAVVYRNAKVRIWAVQGHDFRFASGHAIQVGSLDFSPERITWTFTCNSTECPVTLAVAHHPNWRARINGSAASVQETEDHLMQVQLPPGTSTLSLDFRRAWWESLIVAIPVATLGLCLCLWRGCRRRGILRQPPCPSGRIFYRYGLRTA